MPANPPTLADVIAAARGFLLAQYPGCGPGVLKLTFDWQGRTELIRYPLPWSAPVVVPPAAASNDEDDDAIIRVLDEAGGKHLKGSAIATRCGQRYSSSFRERLKRLRDAGEIAWDAEQMYHLPEES